MAKKQYITTPFGKVLGAYLDKPDEGYQGGEPKYKIRLELSESDLAAFKKELNEMLPAGTTFRVKNPKIGVSVSEATGAETVLPSSKYQPLVFDSKNGKVEQRVSSGSVARALCQLNIYEKGVSLTLCQVQVKELVSGNGPGGSAFGTTDGFVAEKREEPAFGVHAEQGAASTKQDVDALGI